MAFAFASEISEFRIASVIGLPVLITVAHPKIRLTPVHMNEAVKKMYRHVVASGVKQDCPDKNN